MKLSNQALTLDLLEWLATPKRYEDVMDAWRTSCPRLSIWEDALDAGFIERIHSADGVSFVRVTDSGRTFLHDKRAIKAQLGTRA